MSGPRTWLLGVLLSTLTVSGCGNGGSSGTQPQPSPIAVTIAPTSVEVVTNATEQFVATVTGTANRAVTWRVNSVTGGNATVGTITAAGLYTAPASVPSPPTVTITAVSQADASKSASARVTILAPGTGSVNQAPQGFPIKLGTSGGNQNDKDTIGNRIFCCSGTLGALVVRDATNYILSNNHVLARRDQASAGEPINQPGLADTNCDPAQVVANFSQAAPLRTSNVDAAIAAIVPGAVDLSGAILQLGAASGNTVQPAPPASSPVDPAINMPAAKSGRSTGLTCATIGAINTTARVDYEPGCNSGTQFTVTFTNQVVVNSATFSASGDSGSLVVNSQTAEPVALIFGGSTTTTIANPIKDVLAALKDPTSGATPILVGSSQHSIACPSGTSAPAQQAKLSETQVARATAAKERHTGRLMADPAVIGLGVGRSDDNPEEAAIVLYLELGKAQPPIPPELDGIRTKVIKTDRFRAIPLRSEQETPSAIALAQEVLSHSEVRRATAAKNKNVEGLMADTAVIAVGVGASDDSPGEGAVVVYIEQHRAHAPTPIQIDGVRTKVIRTDRFRAHGWNEASGSVCSEKKIGASNHGATLHHFRTER